MQATTTGNKKQGKAAPARRGSRVYSPMKTAQLKERVLVCIAGFGMTQKATAAMLGLSPNTLCRWVDEMGGVGEMKAKFAASQRLFKDSANGLLMYAKKKHPHHYSAMEAIFEEYINIV